MTTELLALDTAETPSRVVVALRVPRRIGDDTQETS